MYQFTEKTSEGYFMFPKDLIDDGNWASLLKAGQAVLPVLCRHTNRDGIAFPSELTIAAISGIDPKNRPEGHKKPGQFPRCFLRQLYNPNRTMVTALDHRVDHLPTAAGFPYQTFTL